MNWEFVIPQVETGEASQAAGTLMDSEEFAGFYERSARSLWAYLARVSGNPALADDLMQETYLRFLGAARIPDGEVASRRYLFRVASNLLRDYWRRPKASSLDEVPEAFFSCGDSSGPSDALLTLGPALAQMRPRDRQILWLAYAEDYTHREIAEITGLQTASIRLLLFRARRKVAGLLRDHDVREVERV